MPVRNIKSDLFKSDAQVIAHGCNCQGQMGAGVAAIIREKYPLAYGRYVDEYNHHDELILGDVQFVYIEEEDRYIANCMTQEYTGTHERQVNYDAIYTSFEVLNEFAIANNIKEVALPCIGAGLAGGNWRIILTMLEEVFNSSEVVASYHTID